MNKQLTIGFILGFVIIGVIELIIKGSNFDWQLYSIIGIIIFALLNIFGLIKNKCQ